MVLQFYDLLNIFQLNGLPSEENPYLFNGDFVDRGSFSVECIFTLFAFKCLYPTGIFQPPAFCIKLNAWCIRNYAFALCILAGPPCYHKVYDCINYSLPICIVFIVKIAAGLYLSRGNHESKSMNKIYGFDGEVKTKFNDTMSEMFTEVFCCLPLANVINGKIFVVHGGLFSSDGVKLSDIRAINRFREPPDEGTPLDDPYTRIKFIILMSYKYPMLNDIIGTYNRSSYCVRFDVRDLVE